MKTSMSMSVAGAALLSVGWLLRPQAHELQHRLRDSPESSASSERDKPREELLLAALQAVGPVHDEDSHSPEEPTQQHIPRTSSSPMVPSSAPSAIPLSSQFVQTARSSPLRDSSLPPASSAQRLPDYVVDKLERANEPTKTVQQSWSEQAPNEEWTEELSTFLLSSFDDLELDGQVEDVDCRTSLCRVRASFASVEEARRFTEESGLREPLRDLKLDQNSKVLRVDAMLTRDRQTPAPMAAPQGGTPEAATSRPPHPSSARGEGAAFRE